MKTTLLLLAAVLWSAPLLAQNTANYRTYIASRPISLTDEVVNVSASSALVRLKLPQLRDTAAVLTIKKIDTTANPVILLSDVPIDGQSSAYILTNPHQAVTLQAQGSIWRVLNPTASLEVNLGTPRDDEAARAVTSANMKVGTYTIANQPDVPRNLTVTHTAVSTADTLGTIAIVGTDYAGNALTETLTPSNGTVVAGTKAFRSVTSITGAGWVIAAGNDTVTVGYGDLIGLPVQLAGTGTLLGALDTTLAVKATTGGSLPTSTVAETNGNASKVLKVWIPR